MVGASLIVGAFILVIPAAVLLMLLILCFAVSRDRYAPYLNTLARGIFVSQNWAMVEVFIIGVIVSLVKIATMATVSLGLSFWAYVAFSICFTLAISGLDRYQCWERLEHMAQQQVFGQPVQTQ
jgi:paraquat-inducible protein A